MANEIKITLVLDSSGAVKNLDSFQSELDQTSKKVQNAASKSGGATSSITNSFKNLLTGPLGIAGLTAGAGAVVSKAIGRAIEVGTKYETQLKNLSAITGIAGGSLRNLGNTAVEESIRTGIAASDQLEAYKLVASQLAEKIDFNTDAGLQQLKSVTREALTLSEAAGIDLKTAVNATSSAINQFGLSAEEASRVVNTLAAGSKFGAAEVNEIAEAMKEAGAGFAAANQPIEATNAGIQVLAANAIKGSQAGTALRNIITILQTETTKLAKFGINDVNVKTDGFANSLAKLSPILNDTTALTQIFGRENLNAAQLLIKNANSVALMQEKVTGTGTAYEQAAIQSDSFEKASLRLANAWDGVLLKSFSNSKGILVDVTNLLTNATVAVGDLFSSTDAIVATEGWLSALGNLGAQLGILGPNVMLLAKAQGLAAQVAVEARDSETAAHRRNIRAIEERIAISTDLVNSDRFDAEQKKILTESISKLNDELERENKLLKEKTGGATTQNSTVNTETTTFSAGIDTASFDQVNNAFNVVADVVKKTETGVKTLQYNLNSLSVPMIGKTLANDLNSIKGIDAEINTARTRYLEATTAEERAAQEQRIASLEALKTAMIGNVSVIEAQNQMALESLQEQIASTIEAFEPFKNAGMSVVNTLMQANKRQSEEKIAQIEKEKERMLRRYDVELERTDLTETQKIELLKKRDEAEDSYNKKVQFEKKKQANRDRDWALAQIAIETAINIAKAFPNVFQMIAAGATGATQAGAVLAQPVPYATGGIVKNQVNNVMSNSSGLMVTEPMNTLYNSVKSENQQYYNTTSASGLQVTEPMNSTLVAVSNGEFLVPPSVTEKYQNSLEMINTGMIQGPGTGTSDSIIGYAENGSYVVNAKATSKNRTALEAMVEGRYANGGIVGLNSQNNPTQTVSVATNNEELIAVLDDVSVSLEELREQLAKGLTGELDGDKFRLFQQNINQYDDRNRVRF